MGTGHDFLHQAYRHLQRIFAQCHGGGSSMSFHAGHCAIVPTNAEYTGHHTDGFAVVPKHQPLLDVRLEVGADRMRTELLRAEVTDARQFFANGFALHIRSSIGMLQREGLGEHARTHHDRDIARAFFIGPDGDLDRSLGCNAVIVQRSHDLDAGQDAVVKSGILSASVAQKPTMAVNEGQNTALNRPACWAPETNCEC